jgi:hypothetical protein
VPGGPRVARRAPRPSAARRGCSLHVARGKPAIKCPSLPNALKDTYDHKKGVSVNFDMLFVTW